MIGSIATLLLLATLGQKSNDFKFDFRNDKFDESLFNSPPETAKYITPEPAGLRITLPGNAEQPGSHVGPYVQSLPEGNFEITLAYEILSRDRGDNPNWGPGVALYLKIDGALNDSITLARQFRGNGDDLFVSQQIVDEATDKGKKRVTKQSASVSAKNDVLTGKLRLTRQGKELFAEFAEGAGRFQDVDRYVIGDAPVGQFRVAVDPSSKKKAIDVRITELEMKRAEPRGRVSRLLWATMGLVLFLILLAGIFAITRIRKKRGASAM